MIDPRVTELTVDFYVAPKRRESGNQESWLIYRRSLNVCVDAAGDAETALAKAIRMAEFCVLGGQPAQVHMRRDPNVAWHTVWRPSSRAGHSS